MSEIAVGIDAGTSNSSIGIYRGKKIETVPNSIGDAYTPSVVDILDEGELVGEETMLHKIDENNSKNRITEIKRIIGRKFSSLSNQEKEKYNATEDPKNKDHILIKVKRKENEEYLSPEYIMTLIFKKLIKSASYFINTSVRRAVITVPADFNYLQRGAINESAKNAGIEVLRIINEPTAAALAYGLGTSSILSESISASITKIDNKTNRKVVVFDLGGGTFDVSILKMEDNKDFQVVTNSGDPHLGGDDFDNKLVDLCIERFCNDQKESVNESEIRKDKNILRRLKNQCEKAKKKLSYSTKTEIKIYNFYKNITLDLYISREDFDTKCNDLYEKIKDVLDKVIIQSEFTIEEIDDVVLVGGSSRIPKIKNILIEKFGKEKIRDEINPDEAVAIGATWQAHKIIDMDQDINISDIAPYSLGVASVSKNVEERKVGTVMSILIPKNKKIPCRSNVKLYKTIQDNQTYFNIQVFTGENRFCKNNELHKELKIPNLPKGKAGTVTLKLSLEINKDSLVFINAEVESIGVKITEQFSLYEKLSQSKESSSKRVVKIKGKEKLEEIKRYNKYIEEKSKLLEESTDNEEKLNYLKNIIESCESLIEIYSTLSEQNDTDILYQKLFGSYKKILKYYSEVLIITSDEKENQNIINKIKEIFYKLIDDDIGNMIDIFDKLKMKKPDTYIILIMDCAEILYKEGEKYLDENKSYTRYYARKFFMKGDQIKSHIDKNFKNKLNAKSSHLFDEFEKKYINKVEQNDAFVQALKKGVELKDTPYITGFTKVRKVLDNKAEDPENVYLALDIFTEMAESLVNSYTESRAFCLLNIIKIKYCILKNQSKNDLISYEELIGDIDLTIRKLEEDDINVKWNDQYEELKEEISNKKKELEKKEEEYKKEFYKKEIEELNSIYKVKIKENKPIEFIQHILKKYPFKGYENKDLIKDKSFEETLEYIYGKYQPDNYGDKHNFLIYNEIYILLGNIKEDLLKINKSNK